MLLAGPIQPAAPRSACVSLGHAAHTGGTVAKILSSPTPTRWPELHQCTSSCPFLLVQGPSVSMTRVLLPSLPFPSAEERVVCWRCEEGGGRSHNPQDDELLLNEALLEVENLQRVLHVAGK